MAINAIYIINFLSTSLARYVRRNIEHQSFIQTSPYGLGLYKKDLGPIFLNKKLIMRLSHYPAQISGWNKLDMISSASNTLQKSTCKLDVESTCSELMMKLASAAYCIGVER